jgi:hypothetical protein
MLFDLDQWRFYLTNPDTSKWTITWIVLLLLFWGFQFVRMMLLADKDLPARYDKLVWCCVFVFALPLAPFVFLFWRGAYKETLRRESDDVFDDS